MSGRRIGKADREKLTNLVLETLTFLKNHTAWSTRTLAAVIKNEPKANKIANKLGCTPANIGRRVASVLRHGVHLKVLQRRGNRFRFHEARKSVGRHRNRSRKRRRQRRSRSSSR